MERLLIIVAVLACLAAGVAVAAMSARGRRPPLRMDGELDPDDEHLLLASVGPADSPIDRSAQVLDAQVLDLEPIAGPERIAEPRRIEAPAQAEGSPASRPEPGR